MLFDNEHFFDAFINRITGINALLNKGYNPNEYETY